MLVEGPELFPRVLMIFPKEVQDPAAFIHYLAARSDQIGDLQPQV